MFHVNVSQQLTKLIANRKFQNDYLQMFMLSLWNTRTQNLNIKTVI